MKKLCVLTSLLGLFLICPTFASAELLISEFSSASDADWVEIYNPDDTTVDLSAFKLRDESATNKLLLEGQLPAHEYIAFDWSDKLNNSGDTIKLIKIEGEIIVDQISYGISQTLPKLISPQTGGRDESNKWVVFTTETKGKNNTSSVFPTPTPTYIPTATPTVLSTPTRTPTPTKSPTKTPTPTPTVVEKVITQKAEKDESGEKKKEVTIAPQVLAKTDSNITRQPSVIPTSIQVKGVKAQLPLLTLITVVGGMSLLLVCGILIFLRMRSEDIKT